MDDARTILAKLKKLRAVEDSLLAALAKLASQATPEPEVDPFEAMLAELGAGTETTAEAFVPDGVVLTHEYTGPVEPRAAHPCDFVETPTKSVRETNKQFLATLRAGGGVAEVSPQVFKWLCVNMNGGKIPGRELKTKNRWEQGGGSIRDALFVLRDEMTGWSMKPRGREPLDSGDVNQLTSIENSLNPDQPTFGAGT